MVVLEGGQDFCNECDQCDQQVRVQTSLKNHEDVVHEGVKYLGDQCDYQFYEKIDLGSTVNFSMEVLLV